MLLIIALFSTSAARSRDRAGHQRGDQRRDALLAAGLMAGYVLVGFDSAGELAEETHNPRRKTAPKTILRALIVSGIGGGLILLAALMAARPSTTSCPAEAWRTW